MRMSFARATRPLIVAAHVALLLAGCAEHHQRHDRYAHHHRWPGDRPEAVERVAVRAPARAETQRVAKPKVKAAKTVAAKGAAPARVATPVKSSPPAQNMVAAPAPATLAPAPKVVPEKPVVLTPAPEKPIVAEAKPVAPALPKESGVALTKDNQPIARPVEADRPAEAARPAPVTRPAPQPPEPKIAAPVQPKLEVPKPPEAALPKFTPPSPPAKAPEIAQPAPTPPAVTPKAVQPAPAPIAPLPSAPPAPQPTTATPAAPAPTATDRPPPAPKAPPAAASPKAPPEGIAALIERTNLLLRIGNVAEARRILEEPVKAKNPDAMAELGRTYDPNELQPFLVPPGSADLGKAIELYTEAGRLGSTIARTRLEKLKATHSSPVPAKK